MTLELKSKLTSVLEDIIVIIVMFGIFLPVRLFFYNYISDNWFGSFGMISLIVVIMVILSKKNKLGFFGRAYWKTITRVHTGKRRILSYTMLGFSLYLWVSIIAGAEYGSNNPEALELRVDVLNSITPEEQKELDQLNLAVSDKDILETQRTLMDQYEKIPIHILVLGALMLILMPILDFTTWAVIVSLVDTWLNGWILHFGTVFVIESLEIIGIMVYTYVVTRKQIKK